MLVLSRRANQDLLFPNVGIRVRVLKVLGNSIRLGIEAPSSIEIVRAELVNLEHQVLATSSETPHAIRNQLNKISLGLHRCQQLWESGDSASASGVFERTLSALDGLEKSWPFPTNHSSGSKNRACRTLLVEDDPNERELLAGLLGMNGCECETAEDGYQAMEYLTSHEPPDLVLLDMGLPRLTGPQTLGRIRNEPRWKDVKVFAVSGSDPAELGITIGGNGVDVWFRKPLNPKQVCEVIRRELRSSTATN